MKTICVGKIVAAHGVKGLVKILPFCDDITLLQGQILTNEDGSTSVNITLKNPLGKYILAEIQGITSREDAELHKGSLYVSREKLPNAEDGEFYIEDLIGRTVLDQNQNNIGIISKVENYGASDILEIRLNNGQNVMIPLTDDFVPEITDDYIIALNYDAFL